ncbi:MAG TPA: POTRA domain-containing protein, partial [Planctomycetota bacterium]|nr:POTRA domain-containing protein [Planctomycetota bacterium]
MRALPIHRLAPALGLAALALAVASPALAAEAETVKETLKEIRIEGNHRVEREAIVRALKNKEGQPFDRNKTSDDIRALWDLKYFADVQLLLQHLPKDGVAYIVRVSEKPAVHEVKLQGNDELSRDDLKDAIDIKTASILDMDAVRRNVKKIQEKYVDKSFFLAEVSHRIDPIPGSNQVDVVFVVREHSKVMVKQINFIGAVRVPAADIKDAIQTHEGGYLSFITSEGTFKEEAFQRDLQLIQGLYYDRGFINVKVDKPWVSISADKRFIYITVKVDEGEQFAIGKLDFSGDLLV